MRRSLEAVLAVMLGALVAQSAAFCTAPRGTDAARQSVTSFKSSIAMPLAGWTRPVPRTRPASLRMAADEHPEHNLLMDGAAAKATLREARTPHPFTMLLPCTDAASFNSCPAASTEARSARSAR